MEKCIPSDPDISGPGVRLAIYAQNLLSFAPAISAIWDGVVTGRELDHVKSHSTTILLTAFGILISAVVQALNGSLTNYHASIVLSLSWMNNTNAFVYLLLFLYYDGSSFTSWRSSFIRVKDLLGWHPRNDDGLPSAYRSRHIPSLTRVERFRLFLARDSRRFTVLVLGSIHLTLMSAIGIWLWSRPRSFGRALDCRMSLSILGQSISFDSQGLRILSLFTYAILLVPGFNVILPATCGIALFVSFNELKKHMRSWETNIMKHNTILSLAPIVIGLLVLIAVNVTFLVDIELTLLKNEWNQDDGESAWTFGQTLAILLLYAPLLQLARTVLDNGTIYYILRREESNKRQERNTQKGAEEQGDGALLRNPEGKPQRIRQAVFQDVLVSENLDLLEALLAPDIDLISPGGRFGNAVQLASYHGRLDLVKQMFRLLDDSRKNAHRGHLDVVKYLVRQGADVNHVSNGEYGTALQAASYSGETEVVLYLLGLVPGADVNAKGGRYGTALQAASYAGAENVIKLLLDHQAKIHLTGGEYGTALHAATAHHLLNVVKLLVDNGADLKDEDFFGQRALHLAAWNGDLEIVEYLLNQKAEVNTQDYNSQSALWIACFQGHVAVVKKLLQFDADGSIHEQNGLTALHIASKNGHVEIVSLLAERNSKLDAKVHEGWTALHFSSWIGRLDIVKILLEKGATAAAENNDGWNSLHYASSCGQSEIMNILIRKGVSIDTQDKAGVTALHPASANGHSESVRLLLNEGASVDITANNGRTALHYASYNGHLDVVRVLLEKGTNVDAKENHGWTALQFALRLGQLEVAKHLLETGASTDIKGGYIENEGWTPLQIASWDGDLEVVKLLMEKGATPNVKKNDGQTSLHIASYQGHLEIVRILLEKGAIVDAKTEADWTPLHFAPILGKLDVLRLLLENGADIDAKTNQFETALDIAARYQQQDIVEELKYYKRKKA